MALQIITNHNWRQFKYRNEVPDKILADDFDWLDDDIFDGFFQYRGRWYHLEEFMRLDNNAPDLMQKWDGYRSDSFFSGVVIKLASDGEMYQVGLYLS